MLKSPESNICRNCQELRKRLQQSPTTNCRTDEESIDDFLSANNELIPRGPCPVQAGSDCALTRLLSE